MGFSPEVGKSSDSGCGYGTYKTVKLTNIAKSCPATIAKTAGTTSGTSDGLDATIFPNPTGSTLKLHVKSTEISKRVRVRILDLQGREFKRDMMMPSETLILGSDLKPGTYVIEVTHGKKSRTLRLTKI